MKIEQAVIDLLKTYFVSRRGTSHVAGDVLPGGTDTYKLGAPTNRWDTIYARQVIADSLTGGAGADNADTVDGFHASATSTPNTLLALDSGQKYPTTAYPDAILRDGSRSLTGNLAVGAGLTIDGVDIGAHAVNDTHHIDGMSQDDHTQYMHISTQRVVTAVHTYNPGVATPFMVLGVNARNQLVTGLYANRSVNLDKSVHAGYGLIGGGQLTDWDVTLHVGPGNNISVTSDAVSLATPGTLNYQTINQVLTAHTHAVDASYNPGVAEYLLKTNSLGELFLGGDFGVHSTGVLYADTSEKAVYINSAGPPSRRGALTVHPASTGQAVFVLESLPGQVANILSVYDSTGADLIVLTKLGDLESGNPNFYSGLTGWQITATGNAEFWNATIRGELHASVFVADEMHATGGTLAIMTAGKVHDPESSGDNVMAGLAVVFYLRMQASWDTGLCYFAVNDIIRIKYMGDDGGGLDIWDVYIQVTANPGSVIGRDLSEGEPGYHRLTCKRRNGGSTGLPIPTGTGCVKWGNRTGVGYSGGLILTSDLNLAPYIDVFTIDNAVYYDPWEAFAIKPRVRLGNLEGVAFGDAPEWGIAFGEDLSDLAKPYAVFSDLQASLHGITQYWWDSNQNIVGSVNPNAGETDALFWLGLSDTDRRLEFTKQGVLKLAGSAAIGYGFSSVVLGGIFGCDFPGDGNTWSYEGSEIDYIHGAYPTSPYDDEIIFTPTGEIGSIGTSLNTGGCVLTSKGTTNWAINPAFNHSTYSYGWAFGGSGSIQKATTRLYGSGAMRINAGSAQGYVYQSYAVSHGQTIHFSVWVRCSGGEAKARVQLWNATDNNEAAGVTKEEWGTYGWFLLKASWKNNLGSTKTIWGVLGNYTNDSVRYLVFDGVMTEIGNGVVAGPFIWGGMPTVGWGGTAEQSYSYKSGDYLKYSGQTLTNGSPYTINLWFRPSRPASENQSDNILLDWYGDSNDYISLRSDSSSNDVRILMYVNGVGRETFGATFTGIGQWDMWSITHDGSSTLKFYKNGVYVSGVTVGASWGTPPSIITIGYHLASSSLWADGWFKNVLVVSSEVPAETLLSWYEDGGLQAPPRGILNFELSISQPGAGRLSLNPEGIFVETSSGTGIFAAVASGYNNRAWGDEGSMTLSTGDVVMGDPSRAAIYLDAGDGDINFYLPIWGPTIPALTINSYGSMGGYGWYLHSPLDPAYGTGTLTMGGSSSGGATYFPSADFWVYSWGLSSSGELNAFIEMQDTSSGLGMYNRLYIIARDKGSTKGEIHMQGRVIHNYNWELYNGGTKVGELSYNDATWFRINQNTGTNIYTPRSLAVGNRLSVGTSAWSGSIGDVGYTGNLRPYRGGFKTAYAYVPLTNMIHGANHWDSFRSGTFGAYYTVANEWAGVPSEAVAIVVRMHVRDSATHPQTGLYFQTGPANATNQNDHFTLHPMGSDVWASGMGTVKITSGTVYIRGAASGSNTMKVFLGVVGYFI